METNKYQREIYIARINKVIDYIENNINCDLSLDELARISCFSRFHFHRIFGSFMNETLNQFIQRIRIERAHCQLFLNPKKSITEIAFECGFASSAAFSRVFKEKFSKSASSVRNEKNNANSKICKIESNKLQQDNNESEDYYKSSYYFDTETNNMKWRIEMNSKEINVEVKEMDEMEVAYVRHIGPYAGDGELFGKLINKLMMWAGPRGLIRFPETQMFNVYHDDPKITDDDKLRLSVCISVPKGTPVEGEIGKMTIPAGKYAFGEFKLATDEFESAWNTMFAGWLPDSGYQPTGSLSYELCLNDPSKDPEHKHHIKICIPVEPL